MATVSVRWTDKAPEKFRANMRYRTRHLRAADASEDSIDLGKSEAAALVKAGWATMAEAEPIQRGPGRPKKIESQGQSAAATQPKDQPYLTRQVLLSVAEKRGVERPPGYVTRDELAALVGDVSSDEVAEAGG